MIGNVDSKLDTEWQLKVNIICNLSVSGAAEQVNSWGGGVGGGCKTHPTACSPKKIFEFACSEIESGAIWRHLKPSKLTQISGVK